MQRKQMSKFRGEVYAISRKYSHSLKQTLGEFIRIINFYLRFLSFVHKSPIKRVRAKASFLQITSVIN